jgi:hypothetical protein
MDLSKEEMLWAAVPAETLRDGEEDRMEEVSRGRGAVLTINKECFNG